MKLNLHKLLHYLLGLYYTRDWVYRDIDGDYQIVGRQDDIIRIKGVWIQVPEIESSIAVGVYTLPTCITYPLHVQLS